MIQETQENKNIILMNFKNKRIVKTLRLGLKDHICRVRYHEGRLDVLIYTEKEGFVRLR